MTDEQFQKAHAVEIAKLAALQGILTVLQSIAIKQGATPGGANWKHVADFLKQGAVEAAKPPTP